MRSLPILFTRPMVLALGQGIKTQTRRLVKLRHDWSMEERDDGTLWPWYPDYVTGGEWDGWAPCPYGHVGDQLYVRETHAFVPATAYRGSVGVEQTTNPNDLATAAIYRAGFDRSRGGIRWRASIHMPRWAARHHLLVTGVRVERLQAISGADALAEGISLDGARPGFDIDIDGGVSPEFARRQFQQLWDGLASDPQTTWAANPWVWVIQFPRVATRQARAA
jgi:hypothetical protein